jgi:hypothetical protein
MKRFDWGDMLGTNLTGRIRFHLGHTLQVSLLWSKERFKVENGGAPSRPAQAGGIIDSPATVRVSCCASRRSRRCCRTSTSMSIEP